MKLHGSTLKLTVWLLVLAIASFIFVVLDEQAIAQRTVRAVDFDKHVTLLGLFQALLGASVGTFLVHVLWNQNLCTLAGVRKISLRDSFILAAVLLTML